MEKYITRKAQEVDASRKKYIHPTLIEMLSKKYQEQRRYDLNRPGQNTDSRA